MAYADYADYVSSNDTSAVAPSPQSLTASSPMVTGTTNYSTDTGTSGSTGGVINSSANPITTDSGPVDASGGNGSIPNALQNIATQGLNDAVISAQEYAIGSLTDLLRVGAQGTTTAASAPSAPTTKASTKVPAIVWVGIAAVVIYLVVRK